MYSSTILKTSALKMAVGAQRHTPAALRPGKIRSHCIGDRVGPRAGLTGAENLAPTGIRFPERRARNKSLYRNVKIVMLFILTIGHLIY